jgi:hypothetical protein
MDQLGSADRVERAILDERLLEADPARDVLHLDEVVIAIRTQVMDGHHVGMDQIRDHASLGPELLANLRLAGHETRIEDLDGARPAKELVFGLIDPGHRAVTDDRPHLILTEEPTRQVVDGGKAVVEVGGKLGVGPVGDGRVAFIVDGLAELVGHRRLGIEGRQYVRIREVRA